MQNAGKEWWHPRRISKWALSLRWRLSPPDYDRSYRVRANGFEIAVLPTVFHPRWHFTSVFFAEAVERLASKGAESVLEVGTGTGLAALSAARYARQVVAVDVNPLAVLCARLNASSNGLAAKVQVYGGDMFAPVAGMRFDLVVCNPPYFAREPGTDAELAYAGGAELQWLSRLGREAHAYIASRGSLICVFGDSADVPALVRTIVAEGWAGRRIARRRLPWEELSIWRFTEPRSAQES